MASQTNSLVTQVQPPLEQNVAYVVTSYHFEENSPEERWMTGLYTDREGTTAFVTDDHMFWIGSDGGRQHVGYLELLESRGYVIVQAPNKDVVDGGSYNQNEAPNIFDMRVWVTP
jgi:hypothetical protein